MAITLCPTGGVREGRGRRSAYISRIASVVPANPNSAVSETDVAHEVIVRREGIQEKVTESFGAKAPPPWREYGLVLSPLCQDVVWISFILFLASSLTCGAPDEGHC